MSALMNLKQEFGSSFLIYALYSGELVGYKIQSWDQFDRHIDRWAQALKVSRYKVATEWMNIWLNLGRQRSSRIQRTAFLQANQIWSTSCGNSQDELTKKDWQPSIKASLCVNNAEIGSTANPDMTGDKCVATD